MAKLNEEKNVKTGGKEALSTIGLILSIFIFLALVSRNTIFGEFGEIFANFILGVFGYSAYAFSFCLSVYSIVKLFAKRSDSNKFIVISLGLILFSGLFALQVYSGGTDVLMASKLKLSEFLDLSYQLKLKGPFGSSALGAFGSLIVFYPVSFLKVVGAYVFAGIVFVGGVFGIFSVIKKSRTTQNNNHSQQRHFNPATMNMNNFNPIPVNLGTRMDQMPYSNSAPNFQNQNFVNAIPLNQFDNNQQQVGYIQQNGAEGEPVDARSVLFPTQPQQEPLNEAPFDYDAIRKQKKNAKLFIMNTDSLELSRKSKKEIKEDERSKKRASEILFGDGEDDLVANKYNKPKNLSNVSDEFKNSTIDEFPFSNKKKNDSDYFDNKEVPQRSIFIDRFNDEGRTFELKNNNFQPKADIDKTVAPEIVVTPIVEKNSPKKDPLLDMYRTNTPAKIPKIISRASTQSETSGTEAKAQETVAPATVPEFIKSKNQILTQTELEKLRNNGNVAASSSNETRKNDSSDSETVAGAQGIDFDRIKNEIDSGTAPTKPNLNIISNVEQIKKTPDKSVDKLSDILFKDIDDRNFDSVVDSKQTTATDRIDFTREVHSRDDQNRIYDYSRAEVTRDEREDLDDGVNTYNSTYRDVVSPKKIVTTTGVQAEQLPIAERENKYSESIVDNYVFPPIDLLKKGFQYKTEITEEVAQKARKLENVLDDFKIPAKVVETVVGPTVTRFELEIPQGIQVRKVEQFSKDIELWLESPSEVIIQAPIPGKNRLGIEVPNVKKEFVFLRDVIESDKFASSKSPLSVVLGKDIAGDNIICDIKKMPHLLVAGATGMGKSVCLNAIILSFIFHTKPEDVRLILIDPKRVEMNVYAGLPHLMFNEIVCDAPKAVSTFNWAINEMENRYLLLQAARQTDLDSYNEFAVKNGKNKLPRIVIIVDELADLMAVNKKEIEDGIRRLAQKARAAGIHLILATQRPSVDIITGVIKTNLPSRISFKLLNGVDSRTVMDEIGAEKLLGNGDMFYKPSDFPQKLRVQGAYISRSEVESVVQFVIDHNRAHFYDDVKSAIDNPKTNNDSGSVGGVNEDSQDDYFVDALRMAIETKQVSISMIQRRYSIGYPRAGKILEQMEKLGYVSPMNGFKPREILITKEEFENKYGN